MELGGGEEKRKAENQRANSAPGSLPSTLPWETTQVPLMPADSPFGPWGHQTSTWPCLLNIETREIKPPLWCWGSETGDKEIRMRGGSLSPVSQVLTTQLGSSGLWLRLDPRSDLVLGLGGSVVMGPSHLLGSKGAPVLLSTQALPEDIGELGCHIWPMTTITLCRAPLLCHTLYRHLIYTNSHKDR